MAKRVGVYRCMREHFSRTSSVTTEGYYPDTRPCTSCGQPSSFEGIETVPSQHVAKAQAQKSTESTAEVPRTFSVYNCLEGHASYESVDSQVGDGFERVCPTCGRSGIVQVTKRHTYESVATPKVLVSAKPTLPSLAAKPSEPNVRSKIDPPPADAPEWACLTCGGDVLSHTQAERQLCVERRRGREDQTGPTEKRALSLEGL
jgi:hypothetical protein